MAGGLLRDPARVPRLDELVEVLGDAAPSWRRLDAWLGDTYGIASEPVFFGRDTGWSARYRRSGKTLVTVIPCQRGFRALVVVGPSAWAGAANARLSEATRALWDQARPYPDGRWLWIDVMDDAALTDIETLVALKSPPPRHARPRHPTLPGWTTDRTTG